MTSHTRRSSISWEVSDALVFVGRSIRHGLRNVDSLLMSVILPLMLLLLFVYVFGGAIDTGTTYINYVMPGIIFLCAGYGSSSTATSVCQDMVGGMIDRFRSLPIRSSAALGGHVAASLVRNLFSTVLVVSVAVLLGFRPTADPLAWLAALGVVALFVVTISWVSVVFGLLAKSVEAAAAFGFFLLFLPYLSSAFVPTDTMPAVLRAFSQHQPITPMIETLRGLLIGTPIGNSAWLTAAWCFGILVVVVPLSAHLFRRRTTT